MLSKIGVMDQRQTNQTDDPLRPSEAEGDRDTIEQDLNERSDKARRSENPTSAGERKNDSPRPSQAEDERGSANSADKQR
jgi:hypothetical protein